MIALLLACTTGADEPTDTSASDSPAGDSADSGDTGETADTGSGGTGLLLLVGSASVDGAWDGVEDVELRGDLGLGELMCKIRYSITTTGTRADCEPCEWAYDVVLGEPEVLVADACDLAGYSADTIATIAGTTRAFGLARDYYGHADVLLSWNGAVWDGAAFADWNETTSTIAYSWDQGYVSYD